MSAAREDYDPRSVSRQVAEAAVWRSLTAVAKRGRPWRRDAEPVLDAMDAYAAEVARAVHAPGEAVHGTERKPDLYPVIALLAGLLEGDDYAGHRPKPGRRAPRRRDASQDGEEMRSIA